MWIHAPVVRAVIDYEDIAFAAHVRWAGKSKFFRVAPGGDGACRPRAMHISSAGLSAALCVTEGSWIDLEAYKKIAAVRPSRGQLVA
jgi:hypothetical protein